MINGLNFTDFGFGVDMNNTTLPIIENKQNTPTGFTELEQILLYASGVLLVLLVLQSICFIIYAMRHNRKRKQNRKHSCIPYITEPLPNEQNTEERYSSRPLRQVSDPEIYESLNYLIEAPPLPPISTLPKRKPGETQNFLLAKLSTSNLGDKDSFSNIMKAPRPRQPLPNEIEAVRIMSGNNSSQTMPRMQFPKPVPTPIMSSTISRFTNRAPVRKMRPKNPEILPPKPQPTLPLVSPHIPVSPPEYRTLPKPKNPVEVPNKYTLPPPEPNHDIPVENELMQKLKKRAQLIPSSNEIPVQQITNNPSRIQPQQIKNEPNIPNELMQKLKKRAALIPDSLNQKQMRQPINAGLRVRAPKSKPPPPVPRRSDSEDTWVDYFDNRNASEQIHMYNI